MTKVDIGYVVGCSFTVLVMLAGVAGFFIFRPYYESWAMSFTSLGVAALAAGVFVALAWPPFNMQYHSYRQTTGIVAEVQTRLVAGSEGGMSEYFAVRFADSPQVYRCDDTRCSLVKPGQRLELWCIREWQQASTPGFRCNYGRVDGS